MTETFSERLDRAFDKYLEENKFSGILRVTCRDEILYQRSIGEENPYSGEPITENSRFTLYSLSKPFCAIGLMKLVDRGLVSLRQHPGEFVPEAAGFDSNVTLSHMLHHTSGMADLNQHRDYDQFCAPDTVFDIRDVVKDLAAYPMCFAPGTSTQYANINFTLTALVIERVTNLSYAEYMEKEVFQPLGMNSTVVDSPLTSIPHRVIGYDMEDGALVPVSINMNLMFGAGDINSDVNDVYRLNHAIKNRLLLSKERWEEILTPDPINTFGCGCSVFRWHGKERITHNGGHIGFRTLHIQLPEDDFDIILLSNYGFGDARNVFAEAVYEAYYGTDV